MKTQNYQPFNKETNKFFPEQLTCEDVAEMLCNEVEIDLIEILNSVQERLKQNNVNFEFSFQKIKK